MLARISTITIFALLAFTACKKEEKKADPAAKPADPAMAGSDKPADKPVDTGSASVAAGSAVAGSAAPGSAAAAPPAELKWEKFTSADGKFTIELPSTPKEQVQSGMKMVGAEFGKTATDDREAMCAVAYLDLPEQAQKADPKVMLEASMAKHKQGATVVEEKDVKLGKNPGKAIVIDTDAHRKHMRTYIANNRIYVLTCGGPSDRKLDDGKIAVKALDSFAFTK